ncbi:hypothetical protein [Streptomyces sp. NPDC013171]|uniref:hypothetical protein n=1 Tax=Streptomyces sp. NPDC013171 TaxID=3364863 RepID=UPI00369F9844
MGYKRSESIAFADRVLLAVYLLCGSCGAESPYRPVASATEARLIAAGDFHWLTVDDGDDVADFCLMCSDSVSRGPMWARFRELLAVGPGGVRVLNRLEEASLGAVSVVRGVLDEGLELPGVGRRGITRIREVLAKLEE